MSNILKIKFSKFIQNFRTLNVFGKFLLIVQINIISIMWDTWKNCHPVYNFSMFPHKGDYNNPLYVFVV